MNDTFNTGFAESGEQVVGKTIKSGLVTLLEIAFSDEIRAWYSYWFQVAKIKAFVGVKEATIFESIAKEELYDHAEKIKHCLTLLGSDLSFASNLSQLLQEPNLDSDVVVPTEHNFAEVLIAHINSEKLSISRYNSVITLCTKEDKLWAAPMFKEILEDEESHLRSLTNLANARRIEY